MGCNHDSAQCAAEIRDKPSHSENMTEETPDPMTKSQREAVCKAWDILCEHFDHVMLVVDFETEGKDGEREDAHEGFWHGGSLAAIGAAEYASRRILESGRKSNEPEL